MKTPTTYVAFDHVTRTFTRNAHDAADSKSLTACHDLTFHVEQGEVVSILGETGSGKSTSVALLLGLQRPTAGAVTVLGTDPEAEFEQLRGRVGIIFQEDRLLPWRTAVDNVAVGQEILGVDRQRRQRHASEWLERLGLSNHLDAFPHQLSGGMRQRVAIARAFAISPELIIGDEAFSSLDEITSASVRKDLLSLIAEEGMTTVFVTHSVGEAVMTSKRVLVFGKPGHVVGEVDIEQEMAQTSDERRVIELVRELLQEAQVQQRVSEIGNDAVR